MNIYNDFSLAEVLWYRIGGATKYLLECQSKEDIFEALDFIEKNHVKKFYVLGIGTNILFPDDYFDGAVVQLIRKDDPKHIHVQDNVFVEAFAGELLDDVIHKSFENNLVGLEWAGGLPGTVGGGVRGNVGAFGAEIKDSFYTAEVLELQDGTFNTKKFDHAAMNFGYRMSTVKQNKKYIILSARLRFERANSSVLDAAKATYHSNVNYRKTNHPLEYPSAGSTFKNIVEKDRVQKVLSVYPDLKERVDTKWHGKVSTAALITKLGFSGYKVGNAQASEKHPNFIVNLGGAKATDVIAVINTIKEKFTQTFGFEPEVEIEIVKHE